MAEAYKYPTIDIKVIKKDGEIQEFIPGKIVSAISKSAERVALELSDAEKRAVVAAVCDKIDEYGKDTITVERLHSIVELSLLNVREEVGLSYMNFRNYKQAFSGMMEKIYKEDQRIRFLGDRENSNKDSCLVATKQALLRSATSKILYERFQLSLEESKALKEGYIYVHDKDSRSDTMNCCLFDMETVLTGGFKMANLHYNEPKSLDVAFDVIGEIVLSAAAQQYGGFTVGEVDKLLEPYAEKTYEESYNRYISIGLSEAVAEEEALKDVQKEFKQGFQGWEMKFNTVGSSRGDYPFITISFGLAMSRFGKMASITCLNVRKKGQGEKGKEKPVLFPKLVFLYDRKIHGEGCVGHDVFMAGIACSQKSMYPDWLSLSGEGYVPDIYKQYGKVISPMGCRAFLSPWYVKGGMYPADETDEPVFTGRFNIGVVSLHLPLIFYTAKQEGKDFFELLDYYLELIRGIHKKTYKYIGNLPASCNPLAYCEGGFLGGCLRPDEKIAPLLKSATASFGITALNELQMVYNGKSLVEDGAFALEVMEYINAKVTEFKKEDGNLYAIYGTPAENLCGKQVEQFREKYGIIEGVSDREYVSNSFHCHVTEDITPTQKQDLEYRFWNYFNGGKIQYVKYPIAYNLDAIKCLVERAMDMGFYEGVNLSLSFCNNCGNDDVEMKDVCTCCGSRSLTKIDRMNGYLSYSQVSEQHSDGKVFTYSRLSRHKMAEIAERKSM